MEKFNFFKGVFLKELLESWRCRLELDVCEWGGGKEGGGGVKNCMTRNRTQLGKRQRGGAPGEKDRQTE